MIDKVYTSEKAHGIYYRDGMPYMILIFSKHIDFCYPLSENLIFRVKLSNVERVCCSKDCLYCAVTHADRSMTIISVSEQNVLYKVNATKHRSIEYAMFINESSLVYIMTHDDNNGVVGNWVSIVCVDVDSFEERVIYQTDNIRCFKMQELNSGALLYARNNQGLALYFISTNKEVAIIDVLEGESEEIDTIAYDEFGHRYIVLTYDQRIDVFDFQRNNVNTLFLDNHIIDMTWIDNGNLLLVWGMFKIFLIDGHTFDVLDETDCYMCRSNQFYDDRYFECITAEGAILYKLYK